MRSDDERVVRVRLRAAKYTRLSSASRCKVHPGLLTKTASVDVSATQSTTTVLARLEGRGHPAPPVTHHSGPAKQLAPLFVCMCGYHGRVAAI
ncbi:hypothetical protein [Nitrosomonas sp. ANs5]|uniref:hypothetical protein n=1 Tax=Nitrosomonas sp. ANs5 TaxID=3423941 RepID=UPI003D34C77D